MGEVIAFQKREKPRHASEPPTGGAQILFFLGVRYVRMEDAGEYHAPGGGPRRGGKRKRRA